MVRNPRPGGLRDGGLGALVCSLQPLPSGQKCSLIDPPVRVTSLDQLVDSAALHGRIHDGMRRLAATEGYAVFSVGVDSLGAPREAWVVESSLPEPLQTNLQDAITAVTRAQRPNQWGWGMLVRLDAGGPLQWGLSPQEQCPPVLVNRSEILELLQNGVNRVLRANPTAANVLSSEQARSVTVQVIIDTLGVVTQAQPETILQNRSLDSLAMSVAQQMRFLPGRVNRRRVRMLAQIPLGFQLPPPLQPDTMRRPPD